MKEINKEFTEAIDSGVTKNTIPTESCWLDYNLDVPEWFKRKYSEGLTYIIERYYKKEDYLMIETFSGYRILCRINAIHFDPHLLCKDITQYYINAIETHGETPYVDDKGNSKFECIINDSQIPGLSKEDFE